MIRILNSNGEPILSLSDDLPEQWVPPKPVVNQTFENKWHYQDHLLVIRSPLNQGDFQGTIEIARNLENFERLNDVIVLVMVIGGLGAIAISGLGGLLLAKQLLKPIKAITETMQRIKHNDLEERVLIKDNQDELSKLAAVFNEMMDGLETTFQKQKQFVEDASHELRTPIAIIEGHLTLLERWGKKDPSILNESLDASLQEVTRLRELVQELLALSKAEGMPKRRKEMVQVDPVQVIRRIVDNFTILFPGYSIELDLSELTGVDLTISGDHFKQVVMILLDNAVKYSTEEKRIQVSGRLKGETTVQLQVVDFGVGIPRDDLPYVFDRFYRVDKARSRKMGGNGLGLAIAKRLVETYGGEISIASEEFQGTVVTLTLPFVYQNIKE